MILQVEIAPVENWCAQMQEAQGAKVVMRGTFVQIDTEKMRSKPEHCGGREWQIVSFPSYAHAWNWKTGTEMEPSGGWICEHMLLIGD